MQNANSCFLCDGNGYVYVLMGGTETCLHCDGKGTTEEAEPEASNLY
ncbi:YuiA family protein [Bacillus songklensis]|uniref:YuiA family protein n=1 Tax=Bacillus songklensis TaxID=1069116 RepID=A0ABV8BC53_9BACI